MKKEWLVKTLALGIIFLFIGINIIPQVGSLSFEKYGLTNNELIKICNKNSTVHNNDIEYWALLIGVDNATSSDLSAEAMYESLLSSQNWKEDNIKLITVKYATKTNIINGFQWLDDNENEDDIVVIYIATHGGQFKLFGIPIDFPPIDEADHCDEYLVTYDSFKHPFLAGIRDDELNFLINKLESCEICIIIDSCFSGGFDDISSKTYFKSKVPISRYNTKEYSSNSFIEDFTEEIKNDGRVILMATQEDEYGYAEPNKGHCFTNVLIKSIGGGLGDFNNDGFISAEEAFNFSQFRLGLNDYEIQHPKMYDGYSGDLNLIVSKYDLVFFDDCESSDVEWTTIDHTGGIGGNLWHVSDLDCGSPIHCWCLGNESTMRYNNDMNNSLVSSSIKLGEKPLLIFISNIEKEEGTLDYLMLDISIDNWSSYKTKKVISWDFWDPKEISLCSDQYWNFSGKIIQMRFRVVSDESIPFNPRTGIGYFMIDDIQVYSEGMVG